MKSVLGKVRGKGLPVPNSRSCSRADLPLPACPKPAPWLAAEGGVPCAHLNDNLPFFRPADECSEHTGQGCPQSATRAAHGAEELQGLQAV